MRSLSLAAILFIGCVPSADQGAAVERLPTEITLPLAERIRPGPDGAMGRNRDRYFHVRFQKGVHFLAYHAIAARNERALEHFVAAMDYALSYQKPSGDFKLDLPESLVTLGRPSEANLASGTAFFVSSAGSGLLSLREADVSRAELAVFEAALANTLDYLLANSDLLVKADDGAPNRLLINALAFLTMGHLLEDERALAEAKRFANLALGFVHEDGYFIEAGGYDSSYNGVALAVAYQIAMFDETLIPATVLADATAWQLTRIAPSGEIMTEGNARVSASGETFLGRKKDVDVAATLLALTFAGEREIAQRVLSFYQ